MAFLLATLALTVSPDDPDALPKSTGIDVPKASLKAGRSNLGGSNKDVDARQSPPKPLVVRSAPKTEAVRLRPKALSSILPNIPHRKKSFAFDIPSDQPVLPRALGKITPQSSTSVRPNVSSLPLPSEGELTDGMLLDRPLTSVTAQDEAIKSIWFSKAPSVHGHKVLASLPGELKITELKSELPLKTSRLENTLTPKHWNTTLSPLMNEMDTDVSVAIAEVSPLKGRTFVDQNAPLEHSLEAPEVMIDNLGISRISEIAVDFFQMTDVPFKASGLKAHNVNVKTKVTRSDLSSPESTPLTNAFFAVKPFKAPTPLDESVSVIRVKDIPDLVIKMAPKGHAHVLDEGTASVTHPALPLAMTPSQQAFGKTPVTPLVVNPSFESVLVFDLEYESIAPKDESPSRLTDVRDPLKAPLEIPETTEKAYDHAFADDLKMKVPTTPLEFGDYNQRKTYTTQAPLHIEEPAAPKRILSEESVAIENVLPKTYNPQINVAISSTGFALDDLRVGLPSSFHKTLPPQKEQLGVGPIVIDAPNMAQRVLALDAKADESQLLPTLEPNPLTCKTPLKDFSNLDSDFQIFKPTNFIHDVHFASVDKKVLLKPGFYLNIPTASPSAPRCVPYSSPESIIAYAPTFLETAAATPLDESLSLKFDPRVFIAEQAATRAPSIHIDETTLDLHLPEMQSVGMDPSWTATRVELKNVHTLPTKHNLKPPEFSLPQEVNIDFSSPLAITKSHLQEDRVANFATAPVSHVPTYLHAVDHPATQFEPLSLENQRTAIDLPHLALKGHRMQTGAHFDLPTALSGDHGHLAVDSWIGSTSLNRPLLPFEEKDFSGITATYTRDPETVILASSEKSLVVPPYQYPGLAPQVYVRGKSTIMGTTQLEADKYAPHLATTPQIDWATFDVLARADERPSFIPSESPNAVLHKIPIGTTTYDFRYDADAPPEALYLNSIVYQHPEEDGKELLAAQQIPPLQCPELVRYPHVLHTAALAMREVVDPLAQGGVMFTYTPRVICNETPEITTISKILNPENSAHVDLFSHNYPSLAREDADATAHENRSILYNLTRQPTGHALNNVPSSEQFDVDVTIKKRKDRRNGHVFSISLYPNQDLNLKPVRQHFTFVIDKTASVKKYRYDMFRQAVVKALNFLQEGDTFNIYVIDRKVNRLSEEPLIWRTSTVQSAKQFLYSNNFSAFNASSTDLYDLLPQIAQELPDNEGENTVILVTDGSSLANIQSKKYTLAQMFENNHGRYTLHTACIDRKSRGAMLDLISTFNRGEFVYSQTNTAFPRKLARLVKHASQLIASDVHITLKDPEGVNVELFPHTNMVPHLYADRPFTIYGTIDEPKDFELIIQGRFEDRYLYLTKHINLTKARKSTKALNKNLAVQQAYVCYEHYLNTHDAFYLKQAEERLAEYKLKPATTRR